jgi:hypothetical protein
METAQRPIGALRPLLFVAALSAVYAVCLGALRSDYFPLHPQTLSFAITCDLTLTVPLLFYLIVLRPTRRSALNLLPIFLASVAVAAYVLPRGHQEYLRWVHVPAALAELAALYLLVRRVRQATSAPSPDAALRQILGNETLYRIVRMELDIWRYGLLFWRQRPDTPSDSVQTFSYQTVGSWGTFIGVFLALGGIEAAVVHVLVQQWSQTAAWVLTALSVYGSLFLWADLQAVRMRPFVLTPETLQIRAGLRWEIEIPLNQIARVQRVGPRGYTRTRDDLEVLPIGDVQFLITVKEPASATGLFGIRRRFQRLGVSVDEPEVFLAALLHHLQPQTENGSD